jgi:undecaprenyl-diphosphatase
MGRRGFLRSRFSTESFFGLYLTAGLITLAVSAFFFALLAQDVVTAGRLTLIDARLSVWLHAHSRAHLTTFFLLVSQLHSSVVISITALMISAYLWSKHLRYWVLTFLLTIFGGMLLNVLLKNLFVRPRPHFENPILTLNTFSYPSGHTMLAVVFYGTLSVFAVSHLRMWKYRVLALIAAILMISLVGFSRMYLGVHYLSDVLGAVAEGLAWLAVCLLIVGFIRNWPRTGNESEG